MRLTREISHFDPRLWSDVVVVVMSRRLLVQGRRRARICWLMTASAARARRVEAWERRLECGDGCAVIGSFIASPPRGLNPEPRKQQSRRVWSDDLCLTSA
jgi:hypothetical protein